MTGGLGRVAPEPKRVMRAAALHPYEHRGLTSDRMFRFWDVPLELRMDQGQTGTCVAHACYHRMVGRPVKAATLHPELITPSEQWVRDLYVAATGDTSLENGTSGETVAIELKKRGLITEYQYVTNPEDFLYHIQERGPLAIGVEWYTSFDDPVHDGDAYWVKQISGYVRGGHEVLIDGVKLDVDVPFYTLLNSWGPYYGHNGRVRVYKTVLEDLIWNHWGDVIHMKEPR